MAERIGRAAQDARDVTLPPLSASAPRRLLVGLHGAGSSPAEFAPVAQAFQRKLTGATALLLHGPAAAAGGLGSDWFDARGTAEDRVGRIGRAADEAARRIARAQAQAGLLPVETILIGFSQGATLALEIARSHPALVGIVVAYAGQLARPVAPGEHVNATVHLLHGELDSWVPAAQSVRAARGLRAIGADVTLDIAADGTHAIDQALISLGTTRVMKTLFRGRHPGMPDGARPTLH